MKLNIRIFFLLISILFIVLSFLGVFIGESVAQNDNPTVANNTSAITEEQAIAIAKTMVEKMGRDVSKMEFHANFVPDVSYKEAFHPRPMIATSKDFKDDTGIVSRVKNKLDKIPSGDKNGYWRVSFADKESIEKYKNEEDRFRAGWIWSFMVIDGKTGECDGRVVRIQ